MTMLVGLKYHIETKNPVTKEYINPIMRAYKKLGDGDAFAPGLNVAAA